MKKLIIIQTAVPDYRKNFFQLLSQKLADKFALYAGDNYFESSVKTDAEIPHQKLKNHYLFKRKFLFQTGLWHLLFSDDILVMEMNPRIINHWIFLLLRKITGKKSVLWGHAWPRKGKESFSDKLRHWMRLLADEIIVYTRQQQQELQAKMPGKTIKSAPNALYSKEMMQAVLSPDIQDLIYVGRLSPLKKVLFLVEAFHFSLDKIPESATLIVVGEGEQAQAVKAYVESRNLQNRIRLLGQIFDYEVLKKLYAEALFSVSPGYIGLSVTQSLGFGVPMLVSRNENHSPEIEAVVEGENALFFETDDKNDFADKLKEIYAGKENWIAKREEISLICKKNYSVEAMAKPFLELI